PFPYEGWSYAYDDMHRLTSALSTSDGSLNRSYAFDALTNLTSNSGVGGDGDPPPGGPQPPPPTTAGGHTCAHDAHGNMTSGAGRTLTWNAANLPTQIGATTFTYDGGGMRVKKVTGDSTTYYPSEGYEVTGGTATKYIMGFAKRVGTTSYWLHRD